MSEIPMHQTSSVARSRGSHQKAQKKSLAASTAGQLLEWYEWSAYAVFAPFIAQVMFNPDNPASALLSTLAVFAVGFLFRPLGGIVFGIIADRKGRKFVLITTMLSMAAASVIIGVLPTYENVGIWASIGLLLARVVQGVAHGGESATANSYVAEIAPNHRRGQWGSVIFVAIFGGSILAYTLGGAITGLAEDSFVLEWGWRIPFLLGAVLALVALYLRRGMAESAVYADAVEEINDALPENTRESAPDNSEPATPPTLQYRVRTVLLIIGLVAGGTAAHYTWTSYASTYAIAEQGMAPGQAYWVSVIAQVIALCSLPFWGRLSDRIGRKPIYYMFGIVMALLQYPLMTMITDQAWTLLVAATIALLLTAASGALMAAVMSEVFPTADRTRYIGLAYSISVAVFGGSAPYLNQLFNDLNIGWMASGYVILLCILTVITAIRLPETRGIDLNSVR